MKRKINLSKIVLGCLFMVVSATLLGCKKEQMAGFENQNNKDSAFQKFSKEKNFWTEEQVENLKFETPDKSVVPVFFKEDGSILSKEELQKLMPELLDGKKELKAYFTDLEVYNRIVNNKSRTIKDLSDYAIPVDDGVFFYNPYKVEEVKRDDMIKGFNTEISKLSNLRSAKLNYVGNTFRNADIILGSWTNGNRYGHCSTVHNQGAQASYTSIVDEINKTNTFDAWGAGGGISVADEIGIKKMSLYWLSPNCNSRARLRASLSSSQISNIRTFSANQDSKRYSWTTTLWANDKWYCSKLVYRAYLNAGINLVPSADGFVLPSEIKNSNSLYGMSF